MASLVTTLVHGFGTLVLKTNVLEFCMFEVVKLDLTFCPFEVVKLDLAFCPFEVVKLDLTRATVVEGARVVVAAGARNSDGASVVYAVVIHRLVPKN